MQSKPIKSVIAGLFLGIAGIVMCSTSAVQASFIGHTVRAEYKYPDLGTVFLGNQQDAVVGAGVEFPSIFFGSSVDISANQILINHVNLSYASGTPFDGFVFSDLLGLLPTITSASLNSTNIAAFDASRITFDADTVFALHGGIGSTLPGDFVLIDVTFASVPEAGTLALFALGLAGLGLTRRRRSA